MQKSHNFSSTKYHLQNLPCSSTFTSDQIQSSCMEQLCVSRVLCVLCVLFSQQLLGGVVLLNL